MRAKYMTLEPTKNRYVRYMRSIRAIQDYLIARAQRHAVPAVNNTNVDRSVATIHATTLGCLRRQARVRSGSETCLLCTLSTFIMERVGGVMHSVVSCSHYRWCHA